MTVRSFDALTGDLFSEVHLPSQDAGLAGARVRQYASNDDADRLRWWLQDDREVMRQIAAWNVVFCHLRAAAHKQAMALPARSVSEDSQRHRVGGAALGIYGENAVTSGSCGK